jgi:virginiamycin B lyase
MRPFISILALCATLSIAGLLIAAPRASAGSSSFLERRLTHSPSPRTATPSIGLITEYPLPKGSFEPLMIAQGPDGALWFTENSAQVGRISTAGAITEFQVSNLSPWGITAGPDGALWFTYLSGMIGRISTSGQLTEYRVPGSGPLLTGITAGPDGALWFDVDTGVSRIDVSGHITQFANVYGFYGITTGSDGAVWFAQGSNIGRLTTGGSYTTYPVRGQNVEYVATGPDHKVWFTQHFYCNVALVGNITTTGRIVQYHLPRCSEPTGIAAGPDGAMWFTELRFDRIDRITRSGKITRYKIPTGGAGAYGITAGPDGAMWFTERGSHRIGRIQAI